MIVVLDGAVGAAEAARLSALDRAAWYGDAAFETFRADGGLVGALDARLARLQRSCGTLGFDCPRVELLEDDLARGLDAFGAGDAYVRLAVSRGEGRGGLLPSAESRPVRSVFVGPLPPRSEELTRRGLRAVTEASPIVPGAARAAGAKVAAYVEPMLALVDARARGVDDAIGLDREGFLTEAITSNVFVWDGETLRTPPDALGILPGITRGIVMATEVARRARVAFGMITVHEAYRAREILLTSSVRGVVSVTSLDGRPVGDGVPGPLASALAAAYDEARATSARAPRRMLPGNAAHAIEGSGGDPR